MKLSKIFLVPVVIFITACSCFANEFETAFILKNNVHKRLITEQAKVQDTDSATQNQSEIQDIPDNSEIGTNEIIPVYFKPYEKSKDEVIISAAKSWINVINPNAWNNRAGIGFPGFRGANQLVIYTPDFGERTKTNEYGAEAVVEGNTVVEISGADSYIPQNGFVISGHGRAKSWINSSLSIGTKVYIDKDTNFIYTYTTSESYIFETEKKIAEAENILNYYKTMNRDYNYKIPYGYIANAKEYLKKAKLHPEEVQRYSAQAIICANDALKTSVPYKNGELKGIWIRPVETTEKDIIITLNRLKISGIDNIFLETYFHGKTIYPSKVMANYGFIPQYEKFQGLDTLAVWIREAHKRGIKVHTWFETFYAGNENPNSNEQSILAVNPSWANKNKRDANNDNISRSTAEHNGYFLDPANPEVQEFVVKLIEEIITKYGPDGINVDYIRYPNGVITNDAANWGYTDYARKDFYSIYGIDPVEIKRGDAILKEWNNYRREQVTDMIRKIGQLGRQYNVYTSAVIFPDMDTAYNNKYQDWRTWSVRNYINGFTPLFLTCDSKTANKMMMDVVLTKSYNTDFYAGLFVTFMGGSDEDLIRQIHEARKVNAKGVILFDYAHLSDKYINTLSASVFAHPPEYNRQYTVKTETQKRNLRRIIK